MKFNAKQETTNVIEFIRNYYQQNHLTGAVLGISGGKDSAVVAALMVEALGKENVIGVTLPCHSKEEDRKDAKLISDHFAFRLYDFDLTSVYDTFQEQLKDIGTFDEETRKNSDINLKPRLRMATVYYLAALFTSLTGKPYLVAGTSNKCELFVGYFTKGGDSVHDIAPIADFTVEEVIQIGEVLGVPEKVLYKKPADGLSNQSDEDKLGVTYQEIATYMEEGEEALMEPSRSKIKRLHETSQHKFSIPTYRQS